MQEEEPEPGSQPGAPGLTDEELVAYDPYVEDGNLT